MSFDLNINNYTKAELIDMFELPSYYDKPMIEMKESKLREHIINNKQISKETKTKTIDFLIRAKTILLTDSSSLALDIYNSNYSLKETQLEEQGEHMVQERKALPYISSFPGEFYPGTINPLKKRTIQKNLNIDTRFRENYYSTLSTNYNINLPVNIDNVIQMQLTSIEVPSSYFVISKQYNNNYFLITVNATTATITIPDGNYTPQSIMDTINTKLLLAGTPFSDVSFAVNAVGEKTGSMQTLVGVNSTDSGVTSITLNFQDTRMGMEDRGTPLPLKLGWNLGFRNGEYVGSLNYVSEGMVDLQGPKYVYLVIDDYNNNVNNNFYSAFTSSLLNKNILARISCQSVPHSIVTSPREYFGPITLSIMNVQLLDEYGRNVDLNYMDYSFCLSLVTAYDI